MDAESRTIDYLYYGDGKKRHRKTGDEDWIDKTVCVDLYFYKEATKQRSLKYLITPSGRRNA